MTLSDHKKQADRIALLFAAVYMVSYITRINYGAVVSEMELETGIPKSLLSLSLTGSFLTYGAGQIISGLCADRYSPKKLISLALAVSVLMNLLVPVCRNHIQMLAVWCVNGLAQAFMWPPLVRMMTVLLSSDDYKKVSAKVSWGSSIGTIIIYLLSPSLITLFSWKAVFVFSALCGTVMIFIWQKYASEPGDQPQSSSTAQKELEKCRIFTPLIIALMAAIMLQGILRDGVTTWMPSFIGETYQISSAVSILSGVFLPLFSILCIQAALKLYRKAVTNPVACAALFFASGSAAAAVLFLLNGKAPAVSVLCSAVLTGCMHGANLMLISMIPPYFKSYGSVSTVSGILNCCTYIGSAVSTYGIALMAEHAGWHFTVLIWLLVGALGALLCGLSIRPWNRSFPAETDA